MNLYPHQDEAAARVSSALAGGLNRLLVQMGTGTGKTRLAASLLRHPVMQSWWSQFRAEDRRVLFFVHREEIVDQAAATFSAVNPGLMVSIEQGPRHANRYADVVVASIQTLDAVGQRRLRDLIRFRPFRMVFCDEAHRSTSNSYIRALVALGFLPPEDAADGKGDEDAAALQVNLTEWDARAPRDRVLIGLTATPNRTDGVGLSAVFQSIAFSFPLRKAVEAGYLVPPVPWVVDTSTSLDGVKVNRSDFNQGDLQRTVNTEERNRLTVAGWLKHAKDRPTIAFTAGVQHAHDLADMYRAEGIAARAVSGETPKDERRATLADYRAGRVLVLTNDSVFTEGTDLPMTSCVVAAKPTKSALVYEQQVGRGLRLYDGKDNCIILDVVDVARKHSLQTAPTLYGLPPGLSSDKGKTLPELADEWDQFVEAHPGVNVEKMGRVAIEQLKVRASTFNVWDVKKAAFGSGHALDWVQTAKDSFCLRYPFKDGTETITISRGLLGRFEVVATFRPGGGPYPFARRFAGQQVAPSVVRQRTLHAGFEHAREGADFAERFILAERPEVMKLTDKNARWKKEPPTERQLAALRWRKIPHRADISRGEASALLDLASARAGK